MKSISTIYFSADLRIRWPVPLVSIWSELYPQLFDPDDVRITTHQPSNHFCEWLTAIYLFHRDGVISLVEKYLFDAHPRKAQVLARLLTPDQIDLLRNATRRAGVQPPDLLVFSPDLARFWFVEVKGPGDRLRSTQKQSHVALGTGLGVPVELVTVRQMKRCLTN